MQPSIRCHRVVPSIACVKHLRHALQSTQPFSTTSRQDQRTSRARRLFFNWIATAGVNLRSPLPGSTNYLNAYTSTGELKRVIVAAKEKEAGILRETFIKPKETPPVRKPRGLSRWILEKNRRAAEKAGVTPEEIEAAFQAKKKPEHNPVEDLPPETGSDFRPFPQNKAFQSQPVLSGKFRQKIWEEVILKGKTVREVSAMFNVEMSRVGAVVRLMEVEKEWRRINKPMAVPYATAVMKMLPQTPYVMDQENVRQPAHESINDLPVHRATGQQIFHPTSESRIFTRQDAAKVFHEKLLPADDRVPHPELAILHKEVLEKLPHRERQARQAARQEIEEEKQRLAAELRAKKEAGIKRVDTGKWEYRFTNISVDSAGKDGRGRQGTGWRYGAPHMDRSKGAVRIPTAVVG